MIKQQSSTHSKLSSDYKINATQMFTGIIILLGIMAFAKLKYQSNSMSGFQLIIGLAMGYILQRSRFGFAGGVRRIYITGDSSLTKALMILFSITIIITTAIHYSAFINGTDIPGIKSVVPANIVTVLGAILFGIGMMFGGGCASGTLTDLGEGEGRAFIVLIFFIIGSLIGVNNLPWWQESVFYKMGTTLYLPDVFGYMGSLLISLLGFLIIYILAKKYENKRKNEDTVLNVDYEEWEKALPEQKNYKIFSAETYHKFFVERWSFYKGAVLFSAMFIVLLIVSGSSWGVTTTFAKWGGSIAHSLGIVDISTWPWFEGKIEPMSKVFFEDGGSLRNIGLILGALVSALLAGRFSLKFKFTMRDVIYYAIAGLMMGYGARIALGCNAGALYSGIVNFSLSGWVYLPSITIGGIIGIKLVKKLKINC